MLNVTIFDVCGIIGVALIIVTYLLLTTNRMRPDGWRYPLLNGLGAVLIMISLVHDFNLSAFIVEAFWATISVVGIVRWFIGRRKQPMH